MGAREHRKWLARADEVEATSNPLRVPFQVALHEAAAAADFIEQYWEPTKDRPGLSAAESRLPRATAGEIRGLVHAVQEQETHRLLLVAPLAADLGPRARAVLRELKEAIKYTLDDGVHDRADDQLANFKKFHSRQGKGSMQLSQALHDYARLADALRDRISEADRSFDLSLIDEAGKLSTELITASPRASGQGDQASAAALTRNRLLHLLNDRIALTRRTAAYVFRKQPEIVRLVTSSYQRHRRADARRAGLGAKGQATPG